MKHQVHIVELIPKERVQCSFGLTDGIGVHRGWVYLGHEICSLNYIRHAISLRLIPLHTKTFPRAKGRSRQRRWLQGVAEIQLIWWTFKRVRSQNQHFRGDSIDIYLTRSARQVRRLPHDLRPLSGGTHLMAGSARGHQRAFLLAVRGLTARRRKVTEKRQRKSFVRPCNFLATGYFLG